MSAVERDYREEAAERGHGATVPAPAEDSLAAASAGARSPSGVVELLCAADDAGRARYVNGLQRTSGNVSVTRMIQSAQALVARDGPAVKDPPAPGREEEDERDGGPPPTGPPPPGAPPGPPGGAAPPPPGAPPPGAPAAPPAAPPAGAGPPPAASPPPAAPAAGPGAPAAPGPAPAPAPPIVAAAPVASPAPLPGPPAIDAPKEGSVADLLARIAAHRDGVVARAAEGRAQVEQAAETERANAEAAAQTEYARIDGDLGTAIAQVQQAATDAQTEIETTRAAQVARVNDAATAERTALERLIVGKQAAVRTAAGERSTKATEAGEKEAARGINGCRLKGAEALKIGAAKAASFEGTKRAGRKKRAAFEMSAETSEAIVKAGEEMAETARGDARKLADKFRKEGEDAAKALNSGDLDEAREKIEGRRAAAVEAIETAARQTSEGVRRDRDRLVAELEQTRATAGSVLELGASAGKAVDAHRDQALIALDDIAAQVVDGLDQATTQAMFMFGAPADRVAAVATELDGLIVELDGQLDTTVNDTRQGMQTAATDGADAIARQGSMLADPALDEAGKYENTLAEGAGTCTKTMTKEGDEATTFLHGVTTKTEGELDRAVRETTAQWDKDLAEGLPAIGKKIDDGLAKQQETLDGLGTRIDERAREIHNESWLSRAFSFVGGIFGGIFSGLWNLVKFLGLLVIAVIVLIVVAVVIAAIVAGIGGVLAVLGAVAAIAGFIASISTALLVIGALVVAGVVALRIYRLVTDDSLTDYESGHLVGESIFDVGTLVFGGKIVKWLGGLAAGGEAGMDAARLAKLRSSVSDRVLEELLRILGSDGVVVERLLAVLGDDAGLLRRLLLLCGDDAARLRRMLAAAKNDAAGVEKLIIAAGGDSVRAEEALTAAGGDLVKAEASLKPPPEPPKPPEPVEPTKPPVEDIKPPPVGDTKPPTGDTAPPTGDTAPPAGDTAPPVEAPKPPVPDEVPIKTEELKRFEDGVKGAGLENDARFKNLDNLTKRKVGQAFSSDPMPEVAKPIARQWALERGGDSPREFANYYEYAKARFIRVRDGHMSGLNGPKLGKAEAAAKAAAEINAEALTKSFDAGLETVAKLGPGQHVGAVEGLTTEQIAAEVQKLDRIAYESPAAEVYHGEKHFKDLPPLENPTGDIVRDFASAAQETIKTGTVAQLETMAGTGAVKVIIRKPFGTPPAQVTMEAIVYVQKDGTTVLASFGEMKVKAPKAPK